MTLVNRVLSVSAGTALLCAAFTARAQGDLWIYTDSRVNGFDDWSWGSTRNFSNHNPIHSGTNSIAFTLTSAGGALRFQNTFDSTLYRNLSFWVHGGSGGGQLLRVQAVVNNSGLGNGVYLAPLAPNTWQHYLVPLSMLGASSTVKYLDGFWFQDNSGGPQPTIYFDDMLVEAAPVPSTVNLSVNTAGTNRLRQADTRWLGLNTAAWDSQLDTPGTVAALTDIGVQVLRWPGGSWGDIYHEYAPPNNGWGSFTTNFIHVATNTHAQVFMIANYGTGTPQEAADWVELCNVTHNANFKYWEIGNECYGSWEADNNTTYPYMAHDGWTYAQRFKDYYLMMKSVDPSIKIGAVVVPGEDSYGGNGGVMNPRTHQFHVGWTPRMLAALKTLNVLPDFVVHHYYAEWTNPDQHPVPHADNDATLLQKARNWALDAADIRQQISDYYGANGAGIELVCTENNSDSGAQGRQSTSLVNALYLADSAAQIMKTEFNAFLWWDLRNGPDSGGDFDPSLYGWRTWGDLGIMYGNQTFYPTYYSLKLLKSFVGAGDTVLNATSDYSLLASYAIQKANGDLALLVINKHPTSSITGQIRLANFVPASTATIRSYGVPQDNAARDSLPASAQDIAVTTFSSPSTNFSYSFPPYSLTLLSMPKFVVVPEPPQLVPFPPSFQTPGKFAFVLEGASSVPFVVQVSSNLLNWVSVSTNTLPGNWMFITNPAPAGEARFWRAIWQR
jgi:alpha-L-arabinofuranosidase